MSALLAEELEVPPNASKTSGGCLRPPPLWKTLLSIYLRLICLCSCWPCADETLVPLSGVRVRLSKTTTAMEDHYCCVRPPLLWKTLPKPVSCLSLHSVPGFLKLCNLMPMVMWMFLLLLIMAMLLLIHNSLNLSRYTTLFSDV